MLRFRAGGATFSAYAPAESAEPSNLAADDLAGAAALLFILKVPQGIIYSGGFLLGNLVAILLATVFVHNKTLNDIFFPVALMLNAIPIVAKAPVLVLILGNGVEPKIAIAALVCFFPTLVNMVRGLDAANPQAMELMRVLSASKTEVFFKLRLYSSLPYLFSALRIAASAASRLQACSSPWADRSPNCSISSGTARISAASPASGPRSQAAIGVTNPIFCRNRMSSGR